MALFRTEALDANANKWLGEIVLVRPPSFRIYTALAVFVASAVLIFLYVGHYTRRTTAVGQLLPVSGLIKVYTPQPGIVLEKHVREGERVQKGALLYVLSSDFRNASGVATQAEVSAQVQARINALTNERQKTELMQTESRQALERKISSLQTIVNQINAQIEGQQSRVALAQDAVRRYEDLAARNFISRDQVQMQQGALLDQQLKLESLERDRLGATQDLAQSRSDLSQLTPRQTNEMLQIDRTLASTRQELSQSEGKRETQLVAPEAGIVTGDLPAVGQTVDGSRPVLDIVPVDAIFEANLYVPSSAVGFIQGGETVLLRYQAYPYQKFGAARGQVTSVARAAMSSPDTNQGGRGGSGGSGGGNSSANGESYYLVKVKLDRQTVHAYGTDKPLQSGMMLEADIFQDHRRLYEWAFAPLYSLSGKIGW